MALWPRDERVNGATSSSKSKPGLAREQHRDYPYIGPGIIGAATLLQSSRDKRLEWSFLNKPSSYTINGTDKRAKFGKRVKIYTPTTPYSTEKQSGTVRQYAEQGANFLRTYVPDAEIPEEIIRAHLVEDTTRSRQMQVFDPFEGNTLEFVHDPKTPFLVFPTGQLKTHLSYAPLLYSHHGITFHGLSPTPLHTFSTPIQQIVLNKQKTNDKDNLFAVRTFSGVDVISVKRTGPSFKLSTLAELTHKKTNREDIIDMTFAADPSNLLLISDTGTLFSCDLKNGGSISVVHSNANQAIEPGNELWRITSNTRSQCFIASDTKVLQVDPRNKSSDEFFALFGGKSFLTSIDDVHENRLCICTTESLIWMDLRFPKEPLLSYAHGRQYDRYLSAHTLTHPADTSLTLLTSRDNTLVQVFDIKHSAEGLCQFDVPPYVMPTTSSSYVENSSRCYVEHKNQTGLLSLSRTGGLSYSQIVLPGVNATEYYVDLEVDESEAAPIEITQPAVQPLEVREHSEVDFSAAYEALFEEHLNGAKEREDEEAEAVYQMIDSFPSYFRTKEVPAESMLTTYDIAFRAGDEPSDARNADLLQDSLVGSKRGFRALKQGKLAPELVDAPWSRSIADTLQELDPDRDFDPNLSDLLSNLNRYRLSRDKTISPKTRAYEQEAAEQLALDLTLSSNIYSESRFTQPEDKTHSLEFMTESLSLGNSLPQVQFGYLKPVRKSHYGRETPNEVLEFPAGVSSLLQAWGPMSADDYVYEDPYAPKDSSSQESSKKATGSKSPGPDPPPYKRVVFKPVHPGPPVIQSQRVNTFPESRMGPPAVAESQPSFQPSQDSFPDLMVSTQPVPGPHGGRPVAKKKPAKKRLGGF